MDFILLVWSVLLLGGNLFKRGYFFFIAAIDFLNYI